MFKLLISLTFSICFNSTFGQFQNGLRLSHSAAKNYPEKFGYYDFVNDQGLLNAERFKFKFPIFLVGHNQLYIDYSSSTFYKSLTCTCPSDIWLSSCHFLNDVKFSSGEINWLNGIEYKIGNDTFNYRGKRKVTQEFNSFACCYQNIYIGEGVSITFSGDTIKKNLTIHGCNLTQKKFSLSDTEVGGDIIFSGVTLPDTIIFFNLVIKGNIIFDHSYTNYNKPCIVYVDENFPIEKFAFNYSQFRLQFPNYLTLSTKEFLLSKLLANQRKIGNYEDIEEADIELKDIQIQRGEKLLLVQKYLWRYGYDKFLFIKWLLGGFGAFWLINTAFFKLIAQQVYVIENINQQMSGYFNLIWWKRLLSFRALIYSFIFSAIIFFGLKMDLHNFSFKKPIWTLYVYVFYLLGLVFVFYIAGLILNKGQLI